MITLLGLNTKHFVSTASNKSKTIVPVEFAILS